MVTDSLQVTHLIWEYAFIDLNYVTLDLCCTMSSDFYESMLKEVQLFCLLCSFGVCTLEGTLTAAVIFFFFDNANLHKECWKKNMA